MGKFAIEIVRLRDQLIKDLQVSNGRETIAEATFFKGEGVNDRQTTVG